MNMFVIFFCTRGEFQLVFVSARVFFAAVVFGLLSIPVILVLFAGPYILHTRTKQIDKTMEHGIWGG